jgi:hypothetical protein
MAVFLHPEIYLEIAREQRKGLFADAERRRIAEAPNQVGMAPARPRSWWERARRLLSHPTAMSPVSRISKADRRSEQTSGAANHFGHRESGGVVVDLYWDGGESQFRVEVMDRREGTRFVLRPTTGGDAIDAFYHPFAIRENGYTRRARAA